MGEINILGGNEISYLKMWTARYTQYSVTPSANVPEEKVVLCFVFLASKGCSTEVAASNIQQQAEEQRKEWPDPEYCLQFSHEGQTPVDAHSLWTHVSVRGDPIEGFILTQYGCLKRNMMMSTESLVKFRSNKKYCPLAFIWLLHSNMVKQRVWLIDSWSDNQGWQTKKKKKIKKIIHCNIRRVLQNY